MNFLKQIKSSVYSPEFYGNLEGEKLSFSIKYFFKLIIFLSFIFMLLSGIFNFKFFSELKIMVESGLNNIPEDLEVNINKEKGLIESNKPDAYFINEDVLINNNGNIKKLNSSHLVVIDTNENFSLNTLNDHSSMISVFKDSIVFYNPDDGNIRIYQVADLPNLKISKQEVDNWKEVFLKFWPLIFILINFMIFFISVLSGIKYLLGALFLSVLIFLFLKIRKTNISFKYAFKISIHLLTAVIILDIIINSFTAYRSNFINEYFSTFILCLVLFFNLKDFKKKNNLEEKPSL